MDYPGLVHGPIGSNFRHLCVDMQRIFLPSSPWGTPWMEKRLSPIEALARVHPERTIFTRFLPVEDAAHAVGMWQRYYRKWDMMTLRRLDPAHIDLVPTLARLVPPAQVLDKRVYSPWTEGELDRMLIASPADTLVISGGETDVCVFSTVLGAIDRGYRVIVAADAVCGSADETHDAAMTIFASRLGEQIELASVEEILDAWA